MRVHHLGSLLANTAAGQALLATATRLLYVGPLRRRLMRAAERWLQRNAKHFPAGSVTLLGDDLYCHQPFCELVLAQHWHFVFTCKPDSHPALYQEIDLLTKVGGVSEVSQRRWTGQRMPSFLLNRIHPVPTR